MGAISRLSMGLATALALSFGSAVAADAPFRLSESPGTAIVISTDGKAAGQMMLVDEDGNPVEASACNEDIQQRRQEAANQYLAMMMPTENKIDRFDEGVADYAELINSFDVQANFSDVLSFYEVVLDMLMDMLVEEILAQICESATDVWNDAVNQAVTAVQSGVNVGGLQSIQNMLKK